MKTILVAATIGFLPCLVSAQVHKCIDAAGKIAFTERACDAGQVTQRRDIPLSTEQTPAMRRQSAQEGKDRAAADRSEAISMMLRDGRIDEARALARTADERAMVNDAAAASAAQKKAQDRADSERRQRESHEKLLKSLKR